MFAISYQCEHEPSNSKELYKWCNVKTQILPVHETKKMSSKVSFLTKQTLEE